MELLFESYPIAELTKDSSTPLCSFCDCMALMVCVEPTPECYFGECTDCPGVSKIKEILDEALDQSEMDELSFKQWVSTDQTKLFTITLPIEEFIEEICKQLENLLCHNFIAKEQSSYFIDLKNQLVEGEFLVICDFAQNYAFIAQDAAQGFYWNNDQTTLHPFVINYRHKGVLFEYLKANFAAVTKISYYSDGAPQQYKNRNDVVNLYYHSDDYGVAAE